MPPYSPIERMRQQSEPSIAYRAGNTHYGQNASRKHNQEHQELRDSEKSADKTGETLEEGRDRAMDRIQMAVDQYRPSGRSTALRRPPTNTIARPLLSFNQLEQVPRPRHGGSGPHAGRPSQLPALSHSGPGGTYASRVIAQALRVIAQPNYIAAAAGSRPSSTSSFNYHAPCVNASSSSLSSLPSSSLSSSSSLLPTTPIQGSASTQHTSAQRQMSPDMLPKEKLITEEDQRDEGEGRAKDESTDRLNQVQSLPLPPTAGVARVTFASAPLHVHLQEPALPRDLLPARTPVAAAVNVAGPAPVPVPIAAPTSASMSAPTTVAAVPSAHARTLPTAQYLAPTTQATAVHPSAPSLLAPVQVEGSRSKRLVTSKQASLTTVDRKPSLALVSDSVARSDPITDDHQHGHTPAEQKRKRDETGLVPAGDSSASGSMVGEVRLQERPKMKSKGEKKRERLEHERLEREKLKVERLEAERLEVQRVEREKLKRYRLEQVAADKLERERLDRVQVEEEVLEKRRQKKQRKAVRKERKIKELAEKVAKAAKEAQLLKAEQQQLQVEADELERKRVKAMRKAAQKKHRLRDEAKAREEEDIAKVSAFFLCAMCRWLTFNRQQIVLKHCGSRCRIK
jgi:hypothetical protein